MRTIYACSRCDFEHPSLPAYYIHIESIHNILPKYTCKICDEKFIGSDEFDKHLQFNHGTNHWDLNLGLKQIKRTLQKMGDEED
jgi:hypothetical protein